MGRLGIDLGVTWGCHGRFSFDVVPLIDDKSFVEVCRCVSEESIEVCQDDFTRANTDRLWILLLSHMLRQHAHFHSTRTNHVDVAHSKLGDAHGFSGYSSAFQGK